MKKVLFSILLIALLAFLFTSFGDFENEETENAEVSTTETSTSEDSDKDESEDDNTEAEVTWEKEAVGPMEFDAPTSWKVGDDAFYSPPAQKEGDYSGYSISVGFNDNKSGNIKFFVDRDLGENKDVDLKYTKVLGYKAARLEYEGEDIDGRDTFNITYYIQIHPDSGLGIISYDAPVDEPDLYLDDFKRLFNSLSIDGAQKQEESNKRSFVLNKSTGVFHEPGCYKVKEIENPETLVSTYDKMISKGYVGCEESVNNSV